MPVPNHDGKAGEAALITREGFDLKAFKDHVDSHLPVYARPRFIRLLHDVETTGTFKYKKMDLIKQGFDVTQTRDPLYVLIGDAYVPLTEDLTRQLAGGELRL
ncbi:MAG: hypothetical protein WDN06_06990 [Asticcacaulis sp.]